MFITQGKELIILVLLLVCGADIRGGNVTVVLNTAVMFEDCLRVDVVLFFFECS